MSSIACIFDGCDRDIKAREWCHKHYMYLTSRGELPKRSCAGCGEPLPGAKKYHSDGCRPKCAVEGCVDRAASRGWCVFHYSRWSLTGDPLIMHGRQFLAEGQLCAFGECDKPARKTGLCNAHYGQQRRTGVMGTIAHKSNSWTCGFCGGPSGVIKGYRKYCSVNCAQLFYRHGGPLPDNWTCSLCEEEFPYVVEGRRRVKADVISCDPCRSNAAKHGYSARQLANRDGSECKLCGEPVDGDLVHPDLMRGSVDHILPRSRGGSNEPENVQLAHLHCNIKKNNRVDYVHT